MKQNIIFTVIMMLFLVLSLPEHAFAAGARDTGVTTLTIAGRDGAFGEAMRLATEEYTRRNPNVRFEVLALSGGELMEQTVIELRAGNGAFDVVLIDDPFLPRLQEAGWLVDLGSIYQSRGIQIDSDLVPNMVNIGRFPYPNGTLYALPHVGNVALFAYRRDVVERFGMDGLRRWDDVLSVARQVAETDPEMTPVLFRGVQGNPIVTGFLPIFWAFGADVLVNGQPAFNSPEALNAVEFFLELAQFAPEGVTAYQSAQVRDAIYSGAGAMAIEVWPGWIGDLENPAVSEVVGRVQIAAHPGQVNPSSSMIGAWMVGIPRNSQKVDAAFDFLQFLTSAEIQEMMADQAGLPPTRTSVHQIPRLQQRFPWYPAQLEGQRGGSVRPRTDRWAQIEAVLGEFLQRALVGELSAADALAQVQRRAEEIMR